MRQQQTLKGDDESFYWVMNNYIKEYEGIGGTPPYMRKHASPTKRLINMKNTAFTHKKVMHDTGITARDS